LNMVALKGLNEDEISPMLGWATEAGMDLSLIETMPLGEVDDDRVDRFLPLTGVLADLRARFELIPDTHRTGGPARYWRVAGTRTRLGLITPLSANFCDGCNRVRLATDGKLYMCLGHDEGVDI
ncbi:cyclic pyranopterin phosphate synthase, partial [Escherichia coli]|nr:cyclic pyranopterin phosphate synthase [Escherichia coli]